MTSRAARNLVVIGGGMAGHRVAQTMLERSAADPWVVTLLAEEPRPPYDRTALSALFDGMTSADLTLPLLDCRVHVNTTATHIDRSRRTVRAGSDSRFPYDALVLATGSHAFIPPVHGADTPGCFTYRTLSDVELIQRWSSKKTRAVVIGGGLLGLEAAGALTSLGLNVTVVEFSDRLMAMQLDAGGGEALRRLLTSLEVRTGVAAHRVNSNSRGRVRSVELSDGTRLPAGIVVFATGVRPRDELARNAGLEIGERGGITVDDRCRTSDPNVYAVGECALWRARCFGLLAPARTMADVAVDQMLGGDRQLAEIDTSTKLKLVGVDVATFGDALAETPGALEVILNDPVAGVYRKLVLSDDARSLLGGVLVGSAADYAALRAQVGSELADSPVTLVTGTADASGALADSATACSCHNVSVGLVRRAVRDGNHDLASVKAHTLAGTGCGSCLPLVKRILDTELEATGLTVSRALCEHFAMSRAELFDLARIDGLLTFTDIIGTHGIGGGCDICKPVCASILSSLGRGHVLDGENAALQDTNDHVMANIQKDGTYSVVPRIPGGEITPAKLRVIADVAAEFDLYTKITGGQRIDLLGARMDQLPLIWQRLVDAGFESGHAYGKAVRTVKSCVGSTWCRFGVQDSVGMAVGLELRYRGLRTPHKLKLAVSGCARECAEARSKDVGIIASDRGWNLYVGGNGGHTPRHAQLLAEDVDDETLLQLIDRFLMLYVRTADRLQRTATWLQDLDGGIHYLRRVVVGDDSGMCEDLEAAMAQHVESYEDEWRATLEDPAKLALFAPCVNGLNTSGETWVGACSAAALTTERGVTAVFGSREVAVFRTREGEVFAVGNRDPYSGADIMSRGIVGTRDSIPTLTSPMHKHIFDLRTGRALLDPAVSLGTYSTREVAGLVEVRLEES